MKIKMMMLVNIYDKRDNDDDDNNKITEGHWCIGETNMRADT